MALTTGDFSYYLPLSAPITSDLTGEIGGAIDTGNPYLQNVTGLFPTGQSNLPGAAADVYYAKLFIAHEGLSGDVLTNPMLYISNEDVSDQIYIAADPYYTGAHAAMTGTATNRQTLPDSMFTGDFIKYTVSNPLNLSEISGSTVTVDSGDSIGVWMKLRIQPGLASSYLNTFNLVLRGEA